MRNREIIKLATLSTIALLAIYLLLFAPLPSNEVENRGAPHYASPDNNLWDIERSLIQGIPSAHMRAGSP